MMPYLQLSFFNPLWAAQYHVSWVAIQRGPIQSKRVSNAVEATMKEWYKNSIGHERTYAGRPGPDWREMRTNMIVLDEDLPAEKFRSPTKKKA